MWRINLNPLWPIPSCPSLKWNFDSAFISTKVGWTRFDLKMVLSAHTVEINFDCPITIPLSERKDVQGLKDCAARVRSALRQNESNLPRMYLIERFLRTVVNANHLSTSTKAVLDALRAERNIQDDFFDFSSHQPQGSSPIVHEWCAPAWLTTLR